jgi:cytochrome c peroxidase
VWNVLSNPDMPSPQIRLRQQLAVQGVNNSAAAMLERAIARFKTPSLRDLGHGDPYLHNGTKGAIEDVLQFYIDQSELARQGVMRNPDPELLQVHLDSTDIAPLAAFLRALNEDYSE